MSAERPRVWLDVERTARKPHVCEECGFCIEPGTLYSDVDTLQEGGWEKYRRCLSCAAWSELVETWTLGLLAEALSETYMMDRGVYGVSTPLLEDSGPGQSADAPADSTGEGAEPAIAVGSLVAYEHPSWGPCRGEVLLGPVALEAEGCDYVLVQDQAPNGAREWWPVDSLEKIEPSKAADEPWPTVRFVGRRPDPVWEATLGDVRAEGRSAEDARNNARAAWRKRKRKEGST